MHFASITDSREAKALLRSRFLQSQSAKQCLLHHLQFYLLHMASFPLRCTVCPKDPTFSDVSHLLTHIASKGHLSHYFKIQVRSRSDRTAEQKLHAYDTWYLQHDIERLLSQRMIQKDTKLGVGRMPALLGPARPKNPRKRSSSTLDFGTGPIREGSVIDPRLPESQDLVPICEASQSTPNPKRAPPARRANMTRSPERDRDTYQLEPSARARHRRPYSMHLPPSPDAYWASRETLRRDDHQSHSAHAHGTAPEIVDKHCGDGVCLKSSSTCPSNGDTEEVESLGDSSRLKGIIWPGMDLFDSACADARRKRNQKKETTVLESMQAQSEQVEPTEVIYFPSWDLKKARFISGEVESSPPGSVSPKKRQRAKSGRRPLSELDVNRPTARTRQSFHEEIDKVQPIQGSETACFHAHSPRLQWHSLYAIRDVEVEQNLRSSEVKREPGRQSERFEDRSEVARSPKSSGIEMGYMLAQNPLHGGVCDGKRGVFDPIATAKSRFGSSISHGLPVRGDIHNGGIFYMNPQSGAEEFRPAPFRTESQSTEAALYYAPQEHYPARRNELDPFYFSIPEDSNNLATRYDILRQPPNPLAHSITRKVLPSEMPKGPSPWTYQTSFSGVDNRASLNHQYTISTSRRDDSSGDETIDQGIDECFDFFES